jgi:hypothetical protein
MPTFPIETQVTVPVVTGCAYCETSTGRWTAGRQRC